LAADTELRTIHEFAERFKTCATVLDAGWWARDARAKAAHVKPTKSDQSRAAPRKRPAKAPARATAKPSAKPRTRAQTQPAPRARKPATANKRSTATRGRPQTGHAPEIATRLARAVPEAECELRFENAFQLVVATILSAQSTDKAVNAVTPALYARYPTPAALAASEPDEVEALIKRTGFFRAKTRSIRGTAQMLVAEFGGVVPRTLEELVRLPGVARKTANVVLGTAYGIAAGFVVDTHVTRVSQRLGLSQESDPVKIEQELCGLFPRTQWVELGHRVLLHGRYTCLARNPLCAECPLNELCPARLTDLTTAGWEQRADREAERVRKGMAGG
jgi:endonuclease-3